MMDLHTTATVGKVEYSIEIDADIQSGTIGDEDADFPVIQNWKISRVERNGRPVLFHSLREKTQEALMEHIEEYVEGDALKEIDKDARMSRSLARRRGGEYL